MWTQIFWIQLVTSMLCSIGFSIVFRLRVRYLAWVAIGGGLTFFLYYVIHSAFSSVFAAAFLATAFSAVFSEICARIKQAPAALFSLPCVMPIVPGGSLYRTMYYLISKKSDMAWHYFWETLAIAIGIAGGIAMISLIMNLVYACKRQWNKQKKENG